MHFVAVVVFVNLLVLTTMTAARRRRMLNHLNFYVLIVVVFCVMVVLFGLHLFIISSSISSSLKTNVLVFTLAPKSSLMMASSEINTTTTTPPLPIRDSLVPQQPQISRIVVYNETNILYTDQSIVYGGGGASELQQVKIPFGIIYLQWIRNNHGSSGGGFINELMMGITSLRKNAIGGTQVPVILFTSAGIWQGIQKHRLWGPACCFNLVLNVDGIFAGGAGNRIYSHYHLKPKIMLHSPFQRSLFLDADTAWCKGNLTVLRSLGKQVDFAAVITPIESSSIPTASIPRDFPGFNTGFFLMHTHTEAVRNILRDWDSAYIKNWKITRNDQPSLRRVLWDNLNRFSAEPRFRLKIFYLPPTWNCRVRNSCLASPSCFMLHTHVITDIWAKQKHKKYITERIASAALNHKWGSWFQESSSFNAAAAAAAAEKPRNLSAVTYCRSNKSWPLRGARDPSDPCSQTEHSAALPEGYLITNTWKRKKR